jgi:hypothetical protein
MRWACEPDLAYPANLVSQFKDDAAMQGQIQAVGNRIRQEPEAEEASCSIVIRGRMSPGHHPSCIGSRVAGNQALIGELP